MAERGRSAARRPTLALERRSTIITLTAEEREQLLAQAQEASATLAQHVRTRCGFLVRNTSLPGSDERYREEDDAWERLKRLGLNPKDYFPPDS